MNIEQEQLAERIIEIHKANKGVSNKDHLNECIAFDNILNKIVIIDALIELGILKYIGSDQYTTRLTEYGWEFPGFEKHRREQNEKKDTEKTINDLTIKQLKGNIFQLKYWWLLLLASGVVGYVSSNLDLVIQCIRRALGL